MNINVYLKRENKVKTSKTSKKTLVFFFFFFEIEIISAHNSTMERVVLIR